MLLSRTSSRALLPLVCSSSSSLPGAESQKLIVNYRYFSFGSVNLKGIALNLPNVYPNFDTYDILLRRYERSSTSDEGERFHLHIIKNGLDGNLFLCNTLLNVFVRAGDLEYAQNLFDEIPERNAVTWSSLISGYTQQNMPDKALSLFRCMIHGCIFPTHYTLGSALRACQGSGCSGLSFGMQIHGLISKTQYAFDAVVSNALVSMYGNCAVDSTVWARRAFDEIVVYACLSRLLVKLQS